MWGRYLDGLYSCVGRFVYCKDSIPRATLGVLVIEGRVVDYFVVLRVCRQINLIWRCLVSVRAMMWGSG